MNKHTITSIVGAALLLISAYFVSQYLSSQKKPPAKISFQNKKKQVRVRLVSNGKTQTKLNAFGRVVSAQPIDLVAEVAGKIIAGQVPLKAGSSFSAGSLLFAIDEREAALALTAQRSSFIKLIANILPDLKIDYSESYPQWQSYFAGLEPEKPLPAPPKYQSEKEKTFLSVKDVMTSYYNIKSAEERLSKYKQYAPISGSFSEVYLEAGSYASANAKIGKIIASGSVEVRVALESRSIEFVKVGQSAWLSAEDVRSPGKIARISSLINPSTQSFDVYIEVSGSKFYDGQYVEVEIEGKTLENCFELEREAIFNQNQVYLVKDSVLSVFQVNILKINPKTVVLSGLPDGAYVVSETLTNSYNGLPVAPVLLQNP
jgi:multidrug efflux pump subunit AcrA (membrane-fusion protein)